LYDAVGERISVLFLTGADYGTQAGPTISPKLFAELYAPFYKRLNDWIHEHTSWKVFVHSCGAVEPLIELFVQAGFDVLNPVQCSAVNMDPVDLKRRYGQKIVFWGGGVDTQETLPFGTAEAVYREVSERLKIFGDGGGYVFSAIHNVQPCTPTPNLLAMFEAYQDHCQTHVGR
jgi:uroporphyrinogen-III decarboxylase